MLILPNTLLDKYDYDLLASKRELKLVCNGKEYFIPINMHKVKNKLEVNCATASQGDRDGVPLLCNKPLVSDQISQDTNSNESEDNESLEKWHAPAGFSLDSDNSTFKKKCVNCERAIKIITELNIRNRLLQSKYETMNK